MPSRFGAGITKALVACACATALFAVPTSPGQATVRSAQAAPYPRESMGLAFDAATGCFVLIGGDGDPGVFRDTWTWDGSGWSRLHPATQPSGTYTRAMVFDAALGQVLLVEAPLHGSPSMRTWMWNGSDWMELHPVHSPPARDYTAMAYDAAAGEAVLFGGDAGDLLNDTWTWDGSDWTQAHPVHNPSPRYGMTMAYDPANRKVVMFGGGIMAGHLHGTWTWDGVDWTRRAVVDEPPGGIFPVMSSRNHVILFVERETWTWDGADWARRFPRHVPPARDHAAMSYDPSTGDVLLFGGVLPVGDVFRYRGDTWTWDGVDWSRHTAGSMSLFSKQGSRGDTVYFVGWGFAGGELVRVEFLDSAHGLIPLAAAHADATGAVFGQFTVPQDATLGRQHVQAVGRTSGDVGTRPFTVTESPGALAGQASMSGSSDSHGVR
jgi:hypothetical protein